MKYNTSFIVFPKHCNHHKDLIFGGAFMAELDLAAAHCVRKALLNSPVGVVNAVTHKAEFEFKKPSYVGDVLDLEANITEIGKKSLVAEVTAFRNGDDIIAVAKFVFISTGPLGNSEDHPYFLPYAYHGLNAIDKAE